jgi:Tol biopolymer transport system component
MSNARSIIGKPVGLTLVVLLSGGCEESTITGPAAPETDDGVSALASDPPPAGVSGPVGEIVFSTNRDGNSELYAINADGSDPVNLTNHPWVDWRPAWSPDGTRIAFAASGLIKIMNADGSDVVLLAKGTHPAWSPDGAKIAFTGSPDVNSDVYVMDADGTNRVNLTRHPATDWEPAWSPDGTRIAFATDRDGNREVYVMNADGSKPGQPDESPGP